MVQYETDADFSCGVCADDGAKGAEYVLADGDTVCRECYVDNIKPMFIAAVEKEFNYPVSWGRATLEPMDFPEFTEDFYNQWRSKVIEYTTRKSFRLYCKHPYYIDLNGDKHIALLPDEIASAEQRECVMGKEHHFLGSLANTMGTKITCEGCKRLVCGDCGTPLTTEDQKHDCKPPEGEGVDPNLGVRGLHYQRCPNPACEIPCILSDGCNTIYCRCRTHYCFLCGEVAHHDSDHWSGNGCPRWNQPGTARAHHDPAVAPLAILPRYTQAVNDLRAEAAAEPEQQFRQMKLDQAHCFEIMGNADARARRAEENGGFDVPGVQFGNWTGPLESLCHSMQGVMLPIFHTRDDRPSQMFGADNPRALNMFHKWLDVVERMSSAFTDAHPAVLQLYPELGPVIARCKEVLTKEISVLDRISVPLVMPEAYAKNVRELRAEASTQPNAQFHQQVMDQATCFEILGEAAARREAEENAAFGTAGLQFREWFDATDKVLKMGVYANLHPNHYTYDGQPSKTYAKWADLGLKTFRLRRLHLQRYVYDFAKPQAKMPNGGPAMMELYPNIEVVVKRCMKLIVREIGVLEEMLGPEAAQGDAR